MQLSKQNKILIGVLITIAIIAFVMWPKKSKAYTAPTNSNPLNPSNNSGGGNVKPIVQTPVLGVPANVKDNFPLKVGSQGDKVARIQRIINYTFDKLKMNKTKLVEDGKFGAKTEAAVKIWFPAGEIYEQLYNLLSHNYSQGYAISEKNPNVKTGEKAPDANPLAWLMSGIRF